MKTTNKLLQFKEQKKSDCFIVTAMSNDDYWNECPLIYFRKTEELMEQVKAAHDLLKQGKEGNLSRVYSINIWNQDAYYLHDSEIQEDDFTEGCVDINTVNPYNGNSGRIEVEPLTDDELEHIGNEMNTEAEYIQVTERGIFRFVAYVKNTNIKISSEDIEIG